MSNSVIESIKHEELKYKNRIYYIAFLAMLLKSFLVYSEIIPLAVRTNIRNIGNLISIFFLFYKIFFLQNYNIRHILTIMAFGLATIYTDTLTGEFRLIPDFLFLISVVDVDFKEVVRKVYKIEVVILVIHLVMYGFFWIFNRGALQFSGRLEASGSVTVRHRILLSHANTASMLVLWTILGYLYAEYDNLNNKRILCAWGAYAFIYLLTDSNSGLIILTVVSIILLVKNVFGSSVDIVVDFLSKYLYIILAIIFNILMVIFTQLTGAARDAWLTLNTFFTGRLLYGAYSYEHYGFTLLGQKIIYNRKDFWEGMWIDFAPCDNAYMLMSVGYGLVYTIAIAYLFWKYSKYARFEEKVLLIAYSLYTMMEVYVMYYSFAFPVIMIMRYVWNRRAGECNMYRGN